MGWSTEVTSKYIIIASPELKTLKANKKPLTDEERDEVMKAGAVWHMGKDGKESPAVWKAVVKGKDWFVCNTHRAVQVKPTLKGAIKSYDFIKTTAALSEAGKLIQFKPKQVKEDYDFKLSDSFLQSTTRLTVSELDKIEKEVDRIISILDEIPDGTNQDVVEVLDDYLARMENRIENSLKLIESHLSLAGLSPILYHYTSLHNAASILEEDQFSLPTFLGSGADQPLSKGKMYYLSTSRQKAGGFHREANSGVVFELDGTKLSHKYGGTPFDYWGEEWRQITLKNSKMKDPTQQYLKLDENEDRLLTNKPNIPKASAYIKSIHVLLYDEKNKHMNKVTRDIVKYSKMKKLPVFVYNKLNDFLIQNKKKALPLSEYKEHLEVGDIQKSFSNKFKNKNPFARYLKVYYAKKQSDLPYNEVNFLSYDDSVNSIDADLHNSRRATSTRKHLEDFLAIWKKEGVKTSKEFFKMLRKKYWDLPK